MCKHFLICLVQIEKEYFYTMYVLQQSKKVSEWKPLKHGDILQISCTRFNLHVHPGTDTCDLCEPGLLIQKNNSGQNYYSNLLRIFYLSPYSELFQA